MPREHPNTVLSRQHFDELAEQYDDLFVSHMYDYDVTHEMILTMLPFSSARTVRVLELGPGTGNLTQKVLTRFPHSTVVGYDLSEQMLAQARAKLAAFEARLQLCQGDISQTVFPGPFDAVISAIAVHHVPPPSKPILFHRVYAALRPGGVLVLGDAFQATTPALGETYRRLIAEEMERRGVDTAAVDAYRSRSGPSGGASTQVQAYLRWMQQAGFVNVDCVWKHFGRAVVYGERPADA
jgi:tRNA (cmo5U34)-methyltransferase